MTLLARVSYSVPVAHLEVEQFHFLLVGTQEATQKNVVIRIGNILPFQVRVLDLENDEKP